MRDYAFVFQLASKEIMMYTVVFNSFFTCLLSVLLFIVNCIVVLIADLSYGIP